MRLSTCLMSSVNPKDTVFSMREPAEGARGDETARFSQFMSRTRYELVPAESQGRRWCSTKRRTFPASVLAQMSEALALFTPLLPRELWREIFQLATFIRGELDIPSTMIRPDLFAIWDKLQPLAWKEVLPCRVAIQSVSRSWHSIGMELLYRSFHHTEPAKVRLFARTLCAQPSYGVLVKRLTLQYKQVTSASISIVQNCPKLLIHSTSIFTYIIEMGWHAYVRLTPLRHFDAVVYNIPLWDLFAALEQCPNLEILALHSITEKEKPPPPLTRSIPLPSLRLLRLHRADDWQPCAPIIERILSSLTLPCLTALSLYMTDTSSPLSLRKDLLSRLTYLGLGMDEFGHSPVLGSLQAIDLPRLRIFRLNTHWNSLGRLLSECPNLPIHQIDTLILSLPILGRYLAEWSTSLDGTLIEACDSQLMPGLKCVILEEGYATFAGFLRFERGYEFLASCFSSLADVFESRGVELLIRNDGIWEGDRPIRDFLDGTKLMVKAHVHVC
jgi:hypothetical protein